MCDIRLRASDIILMYIFVAPLSLVSVAALRYPWVLWYAVLCALVTMCVTTAYVLYLRMRTRALHYQLRCKRVQCAKLESYIKDKRAAHYAQYQDTIGD